MRAQEVLLFPTSSVKRETLLRMSDREALVSAIAAQGDKVRKLKAEKAEKDKVRTTLRGFREDQHYYEGGGSVWVKIRVCSRGKE